MMNLRHLRFWFRQLFLQVIDSSLYMQLLTSMCSKGINKGSKLVKFEGSKSIILGKQTLLTFTFSSIYFSFQIGFSIESHVSMYDIFNAEDLDYSAFQMFAAEKSLVFDCFRIEQLEGLRQGVAVQLATLLLWERFAWVMFRALVPLVELTLYFTERQQREEGKLQAVLRQLFLFYNIYKFIILLRT